MSAMKLTSSAENMLEVNMNQAAAYLQNRDKAIIEETNMINGNFKGKDIVSLDQFSVEDLGILFTLTNKMKQIAVNHEPTSLLAGKIVSLLFFEPSSRTFSSFAAAVKRLGGQTIEIQDPQTVTSVKKGETFEDTIRTFEAYSDAIVLRHSISGSAKQAAKTATSIPVVNAGDGNNEHPTQTLLDLYTLYEKFGRLHNLTCLLAGDPLNSRVIHSLMHGLSLFKNNTVYLLSPQQLRLERSHFCHWSERGLKIVEIHHEKDIPGNCDLWYWTRIQKERFASLEEYLDAIKNGFIVTPELLHTYASSDMILMDPLPRVGTIEPAVDADERAAYFRSQIRNGLYTRMALLALLLGKADNNA
jgi:aspartate carbamoyltransferase catalytic subunit